MMGKIPCKIFPLKCSFGICNRVLANMDFGFGIEPNQNSSFGHTLVCRYTLDVLCRQQIKLFQVVSASEFHEYQWNNIVFIFFGPSGFWRASEASNIDCFKN